MHDKASKRFDLYLFIKSKLFINEIKNSFFFKLYNALDIRQIRSLKKKNQIAAN